MKKIELQKSFVYGPIQSRRLGVSLGMNVLPTDHKICSFNCLYCQYGFTRDQVVDPSKAAAFADQDLIITALEDRLKQAKDTGETFDYITFAGNGEPTLHPDFSAIVAATRSLRDRYAPGCKLAILSNSSCSQLHDKTVRTTIEMFDKKIFKLDAGDKETFAQINQPHASIQFDRIISLLRSLDGVILQTLFIDGVISNCTKKAIENLIICYKIIKPDSVQIYSLDRIPADKRLQKVPAEKLEKIKQKIQAEIPSLPVDVYA